MRQPYVVSRHRFLFAVWLTVVALPVLLIDNIPRTDARAASVRAVSADAIDGSVTASVVPSTVEVTTTLTPSTDGSTAAAAPPTTRARAVTRSTSQASTSTSTSTTTTTEPPTTAPPNHDTGGASWYDYNAGECAHRNIPMGTAVTVTRLATGASTTCVVTDRGPYGAGRIIDLDRGTFAQLADPSEGLIEVSISW